MKDEFKLHLIYNERCELLSFAFTKGNIGDEMADVLWVLMCLANQTGVDLTEALKKNIEKKTTRDKNRHINNNKLTS